MTTKHLKWPFIALLVAYVFAENIAENSTFGISSEWSSTSGYRFSGETQPWALAFSLVVTGLYILMMKAEPTSLGDPLPTVFRRFVAFWLDFILATVALAPILGVVPMLTEWKRTGIFMWHFQRSTPESGDGWLSFGLASIGIAAIVFYYALPLLRSRPSPGTCIAGYQVIPDDGVTLTRRTAIYKHCSGSRRRWCLCHALQGERPSTG